MEFYISTKEPLKRLEIFTSLMKWKTILNFYRNRNYLVSACPAKEVDNPNEILPHLGRLENSDKILAILVSLVCDN